jgi:hypothetical protein
MQRLENMKESFSAIGNFPGVRKLMNELDQNPKIPAASISSSVAFFFCR